MAYIETSAALNINIEKSFEMLAQAMMISFEGKEKPNKKKQSIFLSPPNPK